MRRRAVRAQGTWGVEPPFPWDLDVSFAGVPVADLDLPGGRFAGSVSGTAALAGASSTRASASP